MQFLTLAPGSFRYGIAEPVLPLVRRVMAENPSKFTYHGTGTYIVGVGDVAVIDPGPRLDAHRDALAAALEGSTVRAILVTHCHADHSPLSSWLAAETGAPTVAFGPHGDDAWDIGDDPVDDEPGSDPEPATGVESAATGGVVTGRSDGDADNGEAVIEESTDRDFVPDVEAATGDVVADGEGWRVTALHTPGHTSNHLCFALDEGTRRTLFTGDHVMGWSTTVVGPPDGDMAAYLESLRLVAGRDDHVAVPTHGPPIPDPAAFVGALIDHRLAREQQVLDAVRRGLHTIPAMVDELYADVRRELHGPARRSVLAHLVKLVEDGTVALADPTTRPRLDSTYVPV